MDDQCTKSFKYQFPIWFQCSLLGSDLQERLALYADWGLWAMLWAEELLPRLYLKTATDPRSHMYKQTAQSLCPTVLQEFRCLTSTDLILMGTENVNIYKDILFFFFFSPKKVRNGPQLHLPSGPDFTQDCSLVLPNILIFFHQSCNRVICS